MQPTIQLDDFRNIVLHRMNSTRSQNKILIFFLPASNFCESWHTPNWLGNLYNVSSQSNKMKTVLLTLKKHMAKNLQQDVYAALHTELGKNLRRKRIITSNLNVAKNSFHFSQIVCISILLCKKSGKPDNEVNNPTIKHKQTNKGTHTKKYRLGRVVKKNL